MSVVAVTGCSGYIGSRVLDFLEESPTVEKVVGVDVRACSCSSGKLSFHRSDIRDRSLAALFRDEGVDTVVHMAFILNPLHDDALMYDINVNGARNVWRRRLPAAPGTWSSPRPARPSGPFLTIPSG